MHICHVSLYARLCLKVIVVFAFVVRKFKENRYVFTVHTGSADNFGRLLFFRNFGFCEPGSTQLPPVR